MSANISLNRSSFLKSLADKYQITSFGEEDLRMLESSNDDAGDSDDTGYSNATISDFSEAGTANNTLLMEKFSGGGSKGSRKRSAKIILDSSSASMASMRSEEDYKNNMVLKQLVEKNAQLQHQLRTAEQQKKMTTTQLQRDLLRYDQEVRQKEQQQGTQIALLRERVEQLQRGSDVGRSLEMVKESLRDLNITEPVYLEYKTIPEVKQSVKEFVCTRVFELTNAEKSTREAIAAENHNLRERLTKIDNELELKRRELDHLSISKQTSDQELVDRIELLNMKHKQLQADNTQKAMTITQLESKGELYDACHKRNKELEGANADLSRKDLLTAVSLKSMTEEKNILQTKILDLQKEAEMLKMDKMYLTKETETLTFNNDRLQEDKDRHISKITKLKHEKDELVEKLVTVRDEHRDSYEQRLNSELQRLQERTAGDLEQIRINQREAYEREIKGLREERDRAVGELDKAHQATQDAQESYNELMEEHRKLKASTDTQNQELRNTLKLRAFELERMGLSLEEHQSDFRKLKIENEMQLKKNKILKSEFYALKSSSEKEEHSLNHQLQRLREKLVTYEQLEYELDIAIMNTGYEADSAGTEGTVGGKGRVAGINTMLESLSAAVPTSNKRRIKQSILLAQKLLEKQRQLVKVEEELKQSKGRCVELQRQLSGCERKLSSVQQPHGYLINALEAREEEIKTGASTMNALKDQIQVQKAEIVSLQERNNRLDQDIQLLLNQDQNVDALRAMVSRVQSSSFNTSNSSSHSSSPSSSSSSSSSSSFSSDQAPSTPPSSSSNTSTATSPNNTTTSTAHTNITNPNLVGGAGQESAQPSPIWFKKLNRK